MSQLVLKWTHHVFFFTNEGGNAVKIKNDQRTKFHAPANTHMANIPFSSQIWTTEHKVRKHPQELLIFKGMYVRVQSTMCCKWIPDRALACNDKDINYWSKGNTVYQHHSLEEIPDEVLVVLNIGMLQRMQGSYWMLQTTITYKRTTCLKRIWGPTPPWYR
jgi:hypothetical protein